MARKYDLISELYERTCFSITENPLNWESFLKTAGKNFRLRFDEQLLIFAQRPDATAVLEIEKWNKTFGRWVNRGATGIAVFEDFTRKRQRLTHYFDISDTHASRYARPVPLWTMNTQYEKEVIETLENTFGGVNDTTDFAKVIMESVNNAVDDNIDDYLSDFDSVILGSDMEYFSDDERKAMYVTLVKNSVAYMMMSRLDIDADKYYSKEDFSAIKNFNSQDTLNAIGFATSDIAEMGLMPVSRTINACNRENRIIERNHQSDYNKDNQNTERSIVNETDRIHNGGRLQPAESSTSRATRSNAGEMVADEKRISEESPQDSILQSFNEGENDRTSGTDTAKSDGTGRIPSEEDVHRNGTYRGNESNGYDKMGTDDEQSPSVSSGNREGTSNIRLDEKALPSVNEQLELFEKAEENKASVFSIPQEVIDATLISGSGFENGKMRIYEQFQKSLSTKENADFLKNEYGVGGSSHAGGNSGYGQDHNAKGIDIHKGYSENRPHILLNWTQVAKRIEVLIANDRYLNDKEKEQYPDWLYEQETKRAEILEQKRNREILNTAPSMNEDIIGKEVTIEGTTFVIERYSEDSGDVSMCPTVGYPINRVEKIEFVRQFLEVPTAYDKVEMKPDITSEYEYHLGDAVYIGSEKYEILSFDDERVMLYDYEMPLFNKEFTREDFDNKVRENPLNDFLIVTENELDDEPDIAQRLVRFLKDYDHYEYQDNLEIGDTDDDVIENVRNNLNDGNYISGIKEFLSGELDELKRESPERATIEKLLSDLAPYEQSDEVQAEPIAVETEVETAPTPITPAWEQKKRTRVQSFDLHPDIAMSKRNTFDLRNHPVEEVTKKERFRRNIMAIQLVKKCEDENRFATPEEQEVLSKYVGWGGLSEAFDDRNSGWGTEYLELKTVLSPEEYAAARESTLTAFYTPPAVTSAIYKAMEQMGFKEGNLLEPSCGIGNFIGMLPKSMEDTKIYGVELDKISAMIAQQLYQKSSIAAQGFEDVNVPDSFFDGVVGNVPFGDFKVLDKRYDKHNFLIHDYFFAKSLDKLRPGGVMALVTSKGTMDKENSKVRKYIAQRAELLGAVRLPNNTFKGNAGTEVVSDILFLQKRDRIIDIEPEWVQLDTTEEGIKMNSYFVTHPEMILGEMKMVSGRFGMEATCEPYENADLEIQLYEAVENIHAEILDYEIEDDLEEDNSIPADPTVRNFSYTILDDEIYFRENSRMNPVEVSATAQNRRKGMIGIREAVRTLIEMQTEDYPEAEIKIAQATLNNRYDSYTKKYGLINSRANTSAFGDDSSYSLLSALEIINENGELERKADMFYKRTIKPHTPVTEVDTASEALAVSMGEKACIDMEYMQGLLGKSEEEIYNDLKGTIFLNPMYGYSDSSERKYVMADEYLSGNVREKLDIAHRTAQLYPEDYAINVEALEKVQPKDLTASEISVRLGATWLPPEIVQQYIFEFLETPRYSQWNIKVHFSEFTSEWNIEGKSYDRGNVKANSTYGTSRINAYKIMEETLNLKDVRIFDYIEDEEGKKKAVLNKKETAIAQAKQELIKQGFVDWIWSEPTRRERLTKLYNEKFNSIRPREYDGSHIIFNGMNPEIDLREHQRNAVAHILYGGNTLLAHAVGAGKTFEMVAASQESKRLGLCNKSLFVVPNHLTEQWAAEYLQLYPAANILVATKKDFETKNRKKFCGRIATGDYDAVIIGHSQFEKIPMSIERQKAILQQQVDELTDGIIELKRNRGEKFTIKQLEKSKKSINQKLEKLNDQSRKDDVVTFEELGVDRLFIDESHYYKNLFLYTKMRNVGGIAQTEAQKSSDLFMKCRYLDEITGGRGTVFATGTPISNSMVELYTIQRYLQYGTLVKNNLQHFDAWASTFGETVTAVELTPEGTGYRAKTRFAKFYNLPELMAMFKEVADIKTADMLNLPVPEAKYHNIAVKPSEMQKEMVESLAERAEKVRGGGVDSSVDNMLKITKDGRKLALDQRMLNEMLPDFEDSKINACVENIYRIWNETSEKKSAQLVFCDLSTPKNDGSFSVYNDIRKKLIERGIPEKEVRFIHEADTDMKKKELFQKTRKGEVRVLLGSTQKMGAGTNVQDKLVALHDVDCPWRPSDLEQRSGRIIRQGNENPEVNIYRYVTEQTFDAYLYQLVEGKQKFASQIMTSKSPVRCAEDIDETALSYAEIKMLATGNPYIKEKMDLDIQVQKLKLLKSNFLSEKYRLEDKIIKFYPQRITTLETRIEGLKKDVITAKENPKPVDDRFVGMKVSGIFYAEKAEAGKAIIEACKSMTSPDPIPLGEYRGYKTELLFNTVERNYEVKLKGETSRNVSLGEDPLGNIIRLDNGIDKFAETLSACEYELENTQNQFETAKQEVEKPFVHEEDLKGKLARLDELNILLNMDKTENEIVGGEPDEGDSNTLRKEKTNERDSR
ncbi:helicase-related protein [Aminicella lysinilytica]|uniref:N12 class adenine-specific DNA methylase n=1 Tax=Aminicella lysinilytica TaxID=433323 RepID=A0A4R6Q3H2_9FIRM|nr:helicase-related protein [Aminicella lysinilytica]TDP56390.1 N12 class adenine-specific DNA methylase [Aminicella lysinilytica]